MPIVGRYFPSQGKQEKVFLLLRRHWFTYIPFLAIALIMLIPFFVLLYYWFTDPSTFTDIDINIAILGSSAYLLFIVALLLFGFIDYYLDVYIVTNERIVDIAQDGFFRRSISELYLREVQDVSAQVKGFFATTMHYGEITIQTAGERPNFIFKNVPNPYRISKIIVDLHEAAIEGSYSEEGSNIPLKIAAQVVNNDEAENDFQIDLPAASLARKRTKEYLQGGELVETQLAEEVKDNLEQSKSEKLLKNIDSSKEKTHPKKQQKQIKKIDNRVSGEMHENEEVDL